jgi:hypothetical protein
MAVKSLYVKFNKASGINQALKAPLGTAEDIANFRLDPQGGWLCDRGIEPWWDPSPSFQVSELIPQIQTAILGEKVDSLFIWTKQGSNQTYILVEQGGYLYYIWGNKGSNLAADWRRNIVFLDSGRAIPKANEVGTQYIPYGNRLLIINGVDKPIWFYGDTKQRAFSFTLPTPSPEVLPINPDYLAGGDLLDGTAAPEFIQTPLGLGDRGQGDTSVYSYRMSFILDSGSESPLSAPVTVTWTIPDANAAERRFGVFVNDIPVGPKGCIARRIYRTKNTRLPDSTGSVEGIYYFNKQIMDNSSTEYIDVIPDNSLVDRASFTESSVIDTSYKFGAAWNGSIWLAGGLTHPTKIIYSSKGLPEQFPTFNYFEVGNEKGGAITQLFAYYNNLLVFRESSIEVIRFNTGEYSVSQISPSIGTRASNSIKLVPEIGVVFLTDDGFYAISGGLDGGSQISLTKISSSISKEVDRISTANIAKAVATYSPKEKEYWCHYPVKGGIHPSRGAVIHSADGSWSLRHAIDKSLEYRFYFTAMATDPDGNIILGTVPRWRTLAGAAANPLTAGGLGQLVGLHVWSGAPFWGYVLATSVLQGVYTYSATKIALPEAIYETGWIDFGDNSIKHRVFSVDVEIVSYGDYAINFDWGQDYNSVWNSAPSQKPSKSEILFTDKEDTVFGPTALQVTKVPFTPGKSPLKEGRLIRIRWDVNTSLVDNFRFRLKSAFPMHVLSYNVTYDSNDQLPLNQKPRSNSGQPW